MNEPEQLRTRLIHLRKSKGLTQAEVAERIGVTQATVSRLESGSRSPDPVTVRRYLAAVEDSLTCPVCGAPAVCGYDGTGRPMIHVTAAHPLDGNLS